MEFSSIWYFSFWSLISIVFSTTGIYALHNATIPVSDVLKLFFDTYFALSVSSSISYAFLFRPALEDHDHQELEDAPSNKIFLNFFIHFMTPFAPFISSVPLAKIIFSRIQWNSVMVIHLLIPPVSLMLSVACPIVLGFKYSKTTGNFFTGFAGPLRMFPYHTFSWVLLQGFFLLSYLVCTSPLFLQSQLYFLLTSVCIPSTFFLSTPYFKKLIATSSVAAYVYQQRRLIEIVCAMLANALTQYWFRVQSVALMLAYLSLAMAWLGNLANVQPSTDFGIFQFFVSMGLQSAVSLFGLHFYTFLVVLGGIVLMIVRWKMESVSLRHFGKQESVVSNWKRLEELFGTGVDFTNQTPQSEQPLSEEPGNSNV